MFRQIFLQLIVFFIFGVSQGQSPFDLKHRLPKTLSSVSGNETQRVLNPFDVMQHVAPGAETEILQNKNQGAWRKKIIQFKGRSESKTFLFWALVMAMGYLAFSIAANRTAVGKAWRGFLNNNSLNIAHRESLTQSGAIPYLLLYINFLVNAGIFGFLAVRSFKGEDYNNLTFLALCPIVVGIIFMFKHSMLRLTSWLYPVSAEVNQYNFTIVIFNCVLGLFLLPFNFLIAFAGEFQQFLVFWFIGLVIIFYIYRTLRTLLIGSKFIVSHLFHFLLYLCTAEIAPVLILLKIAMS